jgi:hypothetical protein
MLMSWRLLLAGALAIAVHANAFAEEVEHDVCSCKVVQVGAQSSLRGGVCQRTEAGKCLMQWGSTGRGKTSVGNGLPQEDAAQKAESIIKSALRSDFTIPPLVSAPGLPPLRTAIANLTQVPPEAYEKPGMAESFLLVAATALVRFDIPLDLLAVNLLRERRGQFVAALQKEGAFSVGPFGVKGRRGCLQIDVEQQKARVYVKTPFASSESC